MKRTLTLTSVALCSCLVISSCQKKTNTAMSDSATTSGTVTASNNVDANKAQMRKFYDLVMNKKDLNALDSLVDPGFVDHNMGPGQEAGLAGLKKGFTGFFQMTPDLNVNVDRLIGEDDMVTAVTTMKGTMKSDMGPMKTANKPYSWTGIDVVRFKNGKAVERWGADDLMMKMMPPMAGPAPSTPATPAPGTPPKK